MPKKSIIKRNRNRNPKKKTKKGGSSSSRKRGSSTRNSSNYNSLSSGSKNNSESESTYSITLILTYGNDTETQNFSRFYQAKNFYSKTIGDVFDDINYHFKNVSSGPENVRRNLWKIFLGKNEDEYSDIKLKAELKVYFKNHIPTVSVEKGGRPNKELTLQLRNIRETKINDIFNRIFGIG
tara:strand:+ start:81 stop:623 length:543 start_codon:yes stop_codon:yes gene_type:complete